MTYLGGIVNVKELISRLSTLDPELPVRTCSNEDPSESEISDIIAVGHLTTIDVFRIRTRNAGNVNFIGPREVSDVAVLLFQGVLDDEDDDDSPSVP